MRGDNPFQAPRGPPKTAPPHVVNIVIMAFRSRRPVLLDALRRVIILFTEDSSSVVSTELSNSRWGPPCYFPSSTGSHLMGDRKIEWGVYDPNADLRESHRNLPHRDQADALTFVTFRLADSMPKQVVAQWHSDIEQWLQQNKLGGKSVNEVLESVSISKTVNNSFANTSARIPRKGTYPRVSICFGKLGCHQSSSS